MSKTMSKSHNVSEAESCIHGAANRSSRRSERRRADVEDPFGRALEYFSQVKAGTPVKGNDALENNLVLVERVALGRGLPPGAVATLLDFALSLRLGSSVCSRVLKFLIPASAVPQDSVVRGVSWFCMGKMPVSAQILFLRWILTMFDLIDSKDQLRSIYGFIFSFVTDEVLSPYVCHLLYLLTTKEHVQPFRVRKLLEVQAKMGRQPPLTQLLALYKVLCPEMIAISMPSKTRGGFKNHNLPWKTALAAVLKKNKTAEAPSPPLSLDIKEKASTRKRKLHHLEVPQLSCGPEIESSRGKAVHLQQLRSFAQLLQNLDNIELPAQMGSLLSSSLALHYLDCVHDESALLRLNFWLGSVLHEEFLFCSRDGNPENSTEPSQFLDMLISTQDFLQECFSSSEFFLFKFLAMWDGSLHQPQILSLLSDIPPLPVSRMKMFLFEPLQQLYFTSSVFFKCGVIECLRSMLWKWLTWHFVQTSHKELDVSLSSSRTMNLHMSEFLELVTELVQYVGRLASAGLQLENYHILLHHQTLNFYELVCDVYLKFNLPLFLLPPSGVIFPSLLATDPVTVDRLGYVIFRYRQNLMSAKEHKQQKKEPSFHISRDVFREFNLLMVAVVSCLWISKDCQVDVGTDVHKALVPLRTMLSYCKNYNLIHHPAFLNYAIEFHQKCWPEQTNVDLSSIQGKKYWYWYLEFLFSQGFDGLKDFIQNNMDHQSTPVGGH
ncbi:centromere protein I isoform X2 [Denticeps clupeoides]|uniref:centromere protein I isoform X2 n=1 Tax=Denticeps clupeoides TaxID=299321 RepID=UPI0010A50CA9|nr:centromere protein I isoform X2 [Denticeps clupeoides]